MTINRSVFARQVVGVVFVAFTIAFACCLMPQPAAAESEGGSLRAGGASSDLAIQADGDLQFVGLSGASVTGGCTDPSGYTVYVRDGDAVEFTLAVKNNTSSTIECVNMVDSSAYSGAGKEEIAHFSFPEKSYANSYESLQAAATNAQWHQDAMMHTNYEAYIYEGYNIAANPLSAKVKAKTLKAKYKKLKKKAQKVAALAVSGARGKVAYKIVKIKAKKSSRPRRRSSSPRAASSP